MKVLHVINSFKYAGAEILVRNLITGMRRLHPPVCVEVCTPFQKDFWSEDLRKQGVITHDLGLSRWNILATLIKLTNLIQKESYDIVHVHLWPSLYYLAIVRKMAKQPVYLFTEHNTWNARRKYQMLRFIEARAYLSYHTIICNSQETKSALIDWIGSVQEKIHVLENGVPIPEFQKVSHKLSDPVSLIIIGRLVVQKGMDIAIEAVRLLLKKKLNVTLTIIGEGPECTKLKKMAAGLPVRFIGNIPNPYEIMVRSHILIMPSRWEGFGLTAIEALMIGLPIVASRIDALAHIIEDQKTGLLFRCEDALDLSSKIEELIANEELREKLSFNGRESALHWRIEKFIDDTIKLYHTLLGLGTTSTKTVTKENYRRPHIGQLD